MRFKFVFCYKGMNINKNQSYFDDVIFLNNADNFFTARQFYRCPSD